MADSDDVPSLLRELRDAAVLHQKYIEERDSKQNEQMERSQRIGQILGVLLLTAARQMTLGAMLSGIPRESQARTSPTPKA